MSRIQLALNVNDIDAAVDFYSALFDTAPAKRRPGYANFAVANPPLKLVLFENADASGTLNHLGVERESMEEVESEANRLEAAGLTLDVEGDVVCCYARQDKHWVTGPEGSGGRTTWCSPTHTPSWRARRRRPDRGRGRSVDLDPRAAPADSSPARDHGQPFSPTYHTADDQTAATMVAKSRPPATGRNQPGADLVRTATTFTTRAP